MTNLRGFRSSGLHGAGFQNVLDVRDDGRLLVGGDVSGIHWSDNWGDEWHTANNGLYTGPLLGVSCVKWSSTVYDQAYATLGKLGAGGGFARSTDAGATWTVVSTTVQFAAGNNLAPLPALPGVPHPRSTGNLLALNEVDGYIYAATFDQGVYRSTDQGSNWSNIGLTGHYLRAIMLDPNDPTSLYVASYGSGGGLTAPGVYHCTDPRAGSPTFTLLSGPGASSTPEELWISDSGDLYAVASRDGVLKYTGSWTTLLNDGAAWESIDGYQSGGIDTICVGCFDPIKDVPTDQFATVKRSVDSGATFSDLTLSLADIHRTINDSLGPVWWLSEGSDIVMLGRGSSVASQLKIVPQQGAGGEDYIFSAGRSGVWRSKDSGVNWYPTVYRLAATISRGVMPMGTESGRINALLTDWVDIASNDYIETIIQNKPAPNTGLALARDPVDETLYLSSGDRDTNTLGKVWSTAGPGDVGAWTDMVIQDAVSITDTFARNVTDGWGTADSGGAWTVTTTPSSFSVTHGGGEQSGNTVIPSGGVEDIAQPDTVQDLSAYYSVSWDQAASGSFGGSLVLFRRNGGTFYIFRMRQLASGKVEIAIMKQVGGPQTVLIQQTNWDSSWVHNKVYNIRAVCKDTSPTILKMRAWADGTDEPDTWTLETTDSEATLQTSGLIYCRAQGGGGYTGGGTLSYHSFQVDDSTGIGGSGGARPLGLAAGRNGSNSKVILASLEEFGIKRKVGTGAWTDVDVSLFMQNSASSKTTPMAWPPGTPYVFIFDRDTGVGRSSDYGVTWANVWSVTSPGDTGYLAAKEELDGSITVWVAIGTGGSQGLYIVPDADSSFTPVLVPGGLATHPGPIWLGDDQSVYWINKPSASNLAQLYQGTGTVFAAIHDDAFQRTINTPLSGATDRDGTVYVTTQGNGIMFGLGSRVVDVISTVATIDHSLLIGVEPDQHHTEIHELQSHTGGFLYKTGIAPMITDADFSVPANGMVAMTYDTSSGIALLWSRTNEVWDAVEVNQ